MCAVPLALCTSVCTPAVAVTSSSAASARIADGWHLTKDGAHWTYYRKGKKAKSTIVKTSLAPGTKTPSTSTRYWINAKGHLVTDGLYQATTGTNTFWVYAQKNGALLVGKARIGDAFYLADSKGHLYEGFVTVDVGDGGSKTYYVDPTSHALSVGFFTVDDKQYYGVPESGYVATGTYQLQPGQFLLASATGELYGNTGWLNSASYSADGSTRRYYMVALADHPGVAVTKTGFFKAPIKGTTYRFYGIPDTGYVATGAFRYSDSYTLLASSKLGKLCEKNGWVTTSAYVPNTDKQTYFTTEIPGHKGYRGALTGFFKVPDKDRRYSYYGIPGKGYIAKGPYRYSPSYTLLANPENGHLCGRHDWFTTSKYDAKARTRTYRIAAIPDQKGFYGAQTGLFKVGKSRYWGVRGKGYIRTNAVFLDGNTFWKADKTGKLTCVGHLSDRLNGIDVSSWQSDINLAKVDADFVLIKATEGDYYRNPYYKTMAKQALSSGKLIGFYHFASGGDPKHAKTEADYFIKAVDGYIGQAVLVLDWEDPALKYGSAYAKAFLDRVKAKTGVTPMIYTSKNVLHRYNWSKVAGQYPLWCAQYADNKKMTYCAQPWTDNSGFGSWEYPIMFQYTSNGRVKGYSKAVDLDLFYGTATDWKRYL